MEVNFSGCGGNFPPFFRQKGLIFRLRNDFSGRGFAGDADETEGDARRGEKGKINWNKWNIGLFLRCWRSTENSNGKKRRRGEWWLGRVRLRLAGRLNEKLYVRAHRRPFPCRRGVGRTVLGMRTGHGPRVRYVFERVCWAA